jgi:hypothetical protein
MASWSPVSTAVACCIAAAGCGAGGSESLASRAEAVCLHDAGSPRLELVHLRALHEPRLGPLVAALARVVDDAGWLHVAAVSGDSQMGMSAENLGRRAAARARVAAQALGAPSCSKVRTSWSAASR